MRLIFSVSKAISFSLPKESKIELSVYNIKGQKVKESALSERQLSFIWDGTDNSGTPVSSGIYYYKLNVNGITEAVKKCLLLK